MQAGLLTEIVEIHRATLSANTYGQRIQAYTMHAQTRARVIDKSGRRALENSEIFNGQSRQFVVRRYVDVTPKDLLKWQGDFYTIISVTDDRQSNSKIINAELRND